MALKFYLYIMNLLNSEEGQDIAEYALMLVLVAIAVIVTLGLFKDEIIAVFTKITAALNTAGA